MNNNPIIKVENLTHIYSPGTPFQVVSLEGISLEIARGEFFAVIGSTGSGKSTLVQHFNGILAPAKGKIWVCGADISDKRQRRDLWRRVGLVFQQPEQQLFEETVFDDVAFGPRNMGFDQDEVKRRVEKALQQMGLDPATVSGVPPFRLSGGMRRKVAIAGVLAMTPEVLILDEPAAGLDPQGRKQLMDLVEDFRREEGVTMVLVTHNMEEAALWTDRMAVLDKGRLVMEGSTREVFNKAGELRALGLNVPAPAQLMCKLRAAGKQVRTDVLTNEEAVEEIARLLSET
ncbi:energy-coupling factor transporter ATPase [Pelotomaculum propionicicum]|uniref:Energy-coupling factor transporter ATP-binding protein EcfA2 n=1 Tax=Pelotomaculum propionicicum TaxID=258475 RepID=A0A4Y7RRU5_9FIRM|nr:energy-coupling factor transporter ATPase [Pelotomaculum propionicicum]NLI11398.1 energy-coupling factor transporter ATPase [Peptococcaceae bacterium]TEB11708.1 Energy-coupling factor transporter ATP-binding protein EcfA2 [Pelotomaculum propionicicum]